MSTAFGDEGGGTADGVGHAGNEVGSRVRHRYRCCCRCRCPCRYRRLLNMRARAGICRHVSATAGVASSLRHLSLEGTVRHIGTRLEAVAARNRLPGEQRRDGHRVDRWCAVGSGREVRKAEAVPARRGPVVDLGEQGCAAGGERDVEGAVGGGGGDSLRVPSSAGGFRRPRPGRRCGGRNAPGGRRLCRVVALLLVPGPPDFRATGLLLGNGLGRRCQGLRVVRAGLVGVAVRGGCGVQDCSSGGVSEWEACGVESRCCGEH